VALAPHSPVKESSSKNGAMVLKNAKASQGNVCPVDIIEKILISLAYTMTCANSALYIKRRREQDS
jgi:hypothetical protein